MKHIRIRSGTFETNSSSTHAYTVCTGRTPKATFRPIITETPILVTAGMSCDEDWNTKLSALVGYLYFKGRTDEIEKVQDIFKRFTGTEPSFDFTRIKESMEHEKWPLDLEGFFEDFSVRGHSDEYGNEPKELEEFFDKILLKEDDILGFVCSHGWIDVNEYYDG